MAPPLCHDRWKGWASHLSRHAVAQREPFIFRTPLPDNGLPLAIAAELNARAFSLAAHRPNVTFDSHRVIAVKPVVLERACEVAAIVFVPAHNAQGVKWSVDPRALILNQEELAGVPARAMAARPLRRLSARALRVLVGTAEGLSFGLPVALKNFERVVLRASFKSFLHLVFLKVVPLCGQRVCPVLHHRSRGRLPPVTPNARHKGRALVRPV